MWAQSLSILPSSAVVRAIGSTLVFTCSVDNAGNQDANLRWHNVQNEEIADIEGR